MSSSAATLCAGSMCFGYQKVEKSYGLPRSSIISTRRCGLISSTSTRPQKHVLSDGFGKKFHLIQGHSQINFHMSSLVNASSKSFSSRVCQVQSGDSEGYIGHDSIILQQQMLEQELRNAIAEENYVKAAKIRDNIKNLNEDSRASVLTANAQFYDSFRNGDITAMQAVWSRGDNVSCVHPGSLGICGYESVIESWNVVWADYEFPLEIELRDLHVHVRGDLGYITCVELVKTKGSSWGGQFVTNVFEKVDGQWFICIHHASVFDF